MAPRTRTDLKNELTANEFVAALIPDGALVSNPWRKTGAPDPNDPWPPRRFDTAIPLVDECYVNWATSSSGRARTKDYLAQWFLMLDDVGTKVTLTQAQLDAATYRIETSKDNFQVGYSFKEPLSLADNNRLRPALVAAKLGDIGALKTAHRWCRVPGSRNMKPERNGWVSVLRQWQPEKRYTFAELGDLLGIDLDEKTPLTRPAGLGSYKDVTFDRMRALPRGSRGSLLSDKPDGKGFFKLVCPWYDDETSHSATNEATYRPGSGDTPPAFKCFHTHGKDASTANGTYGTTEFVNWVREHACVGPPVVESEIRSVDWVRVARDGAPTAPDNIINKWIEAREVTLMAAHGGSGKGYIALRMAVCIALGVPFCNSQTARCKTLFFSAEDSADTIARRAAAICDEMGVDIGELDGWLEVRDVSSLDATELYDHEAKLTSLYEWLDGFVVRNKIRAVFVDNASDVYGANEIARAQVRKFVRALRRMAAGSDGCVVLLAHANKQSAKNPGADNESYSGSTAWHNSVRCRIQIVPERDEDTGQSTSFIVSVEKMNYGKADARLRMTWSDDAHTFVVEDAPRGAADRDLVLLGIAVLGEKGIRLSVSSKATGVRNTRNQLITGGFVAKGTKAATLDKLFMRLEQERLVGRGSDTGARNTVVASWSLTTAGMAAAHNRSLQEDREDWRYVMPKKREPQAGEASHQRICVT